MLAFPHTYRHRPEDMWYSMCLIRHPHPTAEIGFKINTNPILKVLLSLPHAGQIEHLAFMLSGGSTGRSLGTAQWSAI